MEIALVIIIALLAVIAVAVCRIATAQEARPEPPLTAMEEWEIEEMDDAREEMDRK